MRATTGLLFVIAGFLVGGCAASLHPVAGQKDGVFDPAVIGTWEDAKPDSDKSPVTVVSKNNASYEVSFTDEKKSLVQVYDVQLFRLGDAIFYDGSFSHLTFKNENYASDDLVVYPTHAFGRIWISPDEIRVGALDEDWLKNALDDGIVNLAFERPVRDTGIDILLTAPSEEVRGFAQKYADDKKVFPPETVFRRKK
jgi:hypothetical protein